MEDNLKILKVEYLSNHLLNPTQILNLSLDDKTMLYKFFKRRQPPMKDDLKILDHTNILNWSVYDHILSIL